MRVNNIFTNLIGFMVVLFSDFFTKLVSAQEENNDAEDTEPSGDCGLNNDDENVTELSGDCGWDGLDEDPNNVNSLDNDFDMKKWLIIGGGVAAVVIGFIVILATRKNRRKY